MTGPIIPPAGVDGPIPPFPPLPLGHWFPPPPSVN
jgi:hypothetical protein